MGIEKIASNLGVSAGELDKLAEEFLEKQAKAAEVGGKVMGALKRYAELMKGGKKMNFATGSKKRAIGKLYEGKRPGNVAGGYKPGEHGHGEARKEALKSLAARAGTAAVVAEGGRRAKNKMTKKASQEDLIEQLAQEFLDGMEKQALSPELAGKASAMRRTRIAKKMMSGGDVEPMDIKKMTTHAEQGVRQAKKGQFGKYLQSAAKEHGQGRLGQLSARVQGSLIGKLIGKK